jgi:hypothetical protein
VIKLNADNADLNGFQLVNLKKYFILIDFNKLFMSSVLHRDLTQSIIKHFFDVYNELGYGFLERVYQNAIYHELKENGFKVEAQKKN